LNFAHDSASAGVHTPTHNTQGLGLLLRVCSKTNSLNSPKDFKSTLGDTRNILDEQSVESSTQLVHLLTV
jgi:hypothetical protein